LALLIFDARVPKAYFRPPPGVHLASGDALPGLDFSSCSECVSDGCDVEVCFFQYTIPEWSREFFGIPAILKKFLPPELRRHRFFRGLDSNDEVRFWVRVCPMGWSWAVALVQAGHEWILRGARPELRWARDKVPTAPLSGVHAVMVSVVPFSTPKLGREPFFCSLFARVFRPA
jgi:hypothetical protein